MKQMKIAHVLQVGDMLHPSSQLQQVYHWLRDRGGRVGRQRGDKALDVVTIDSIDNTA